MNRRFLKFTVLIPFILLQSCKSVKEIAYLQNPIQLSDSLHCMTKNSIYDARIKPKDMLSIAVVTSLTEASRDYNLIMPQVGDISNSSQSLTQQPILQTYLVNTDGNIDFPVFGKLKVVGLTVKELESLIQNKLSTSFSNERPIVTIRFANYSVSFLGEVSRPGKYSVNNERITIFDGLALAGDLTIYGKRNTIKVLREFADGTRKIITIDITSSNVLNSSAYFLEQNDVVYVEPNISKTRSANIGSAENLEVTSLSILISMTSLLFNILRK
jgi:polysaccharide biosynthesis/export protein